MWAARRRSSNLAQPSSQNRNRIRASVGRHLLARSTGSRIFLPQPVHPLQKQVQVMYCTRVEAARMFYLSILGSAGQASDADSSWAHCCPVTCRRQVHAGHCRGSNEVKGLYYCTPSKSIFVSAGNQSRLCGSNHHAFLDPTRSLMGRVCSSHFVTINVTSGPGLRIQSGTPATLGYATGR